MNHEDSIINLAMTILESGLSKRHIHSPARCCYTIFAPAPPEPGKRIFGALYLDNLNQLISFEIIHSGSINSVQISPREVARLALKLNAQAVIFAHNHPSGSPEPSRADINITARLKTALELFEIRTLDHFIVAGNDVISMAERGHI
ncbi:RadC family protein [Buttiauxella sp. 3AFRM03]|uniref:JAB domain-containing protein n=1 Tax=Buttiauxella sp. 3AFRM03 TaxID=2479367 RepID=UPI001EE47F16|nr:JAB domain-containing protein [Buttiauxella sp. 3AFRM03]